MLERTPIQRVVGSPDIDTGLAAHDKVGRPRRAAEAQIFCEKIVAALFDETTGMEQFDAGAGRSDERTA